MVTPAALRNNEKQNRDQEPIAIIGIGCRFPGNANTPQIFWQHLCQGKDAIQEVPANRWDVDVFYSSDPATPGKINTRWGGFVENIDQFDTHFFGISPREASRMDPQHRMLLEVAWEAMEDGGQLASELETTNVGVFIGISSHDYGDILGGASERDTINAYSNLGAALSLAANRISYAFNFKGPSLAVDTACSSALVAVHLACQSIWRGESTLAMAGGVNAIFKPEGAIGFAKASMLSPNGRCYSFDERADGFVRAEGAGIVLLKPLSEAVADADPIYALIRNTAVNQDGRTKGITVPSEQSQAAMLAQVYRQVGIKPAEVQYIEAHGTGTPVGDPIEVRAIATAINSERKPDHVCLIGSVKSNFGHLESGSGIAGLIKTALCLKHGEVPPNLHYKSPNPDIPFDQLPLRVPTEVETWPSYGERRIAGVNSFGFGGTNAHVVLEGYGELGPAPHNGAHEEERTKTHQMSFVLPISARTESALHDLADKFHHFLLETAHDIRDICYSATFRRTHHEYRLAVVGRNKAELADRLVGFTSNGINTVGIASGRQSSNPTASLTFVFTGMGPQWWAMGRELLESSALFRTQIETIDRQLKQHTTWSLTEELTASEETSRIQRTEIAQPAIFAIQVAVAALWRSWGIVPDFVVGHSVGEVAAAHVAGVLSLDDAIKVIYHRSRLQSKTVGKGVMLAVGLSAKAVQPYINNHDDIVSISAINSPQAVTLAGDEQTLHIISTALNEQGLFNRFLQVEVPYHSPVMDTIRPELEVSLQNIQPQRAKIPLYSTVLGQQVEGTELNNFYWGRNIREPVHFAPAIEQLLAAKCEYFIEIGPHPVLSQAIQECAAVQTRTATVLPSLRRKWPEEDVMLTTLGALYANGYSIDWTRQYPISGRFVRLPGYPWQHETYWHESEISRRVRLGHSQTFSLDDSPHPLIGHRLMAVQPTWNTAVSLQSIPFLRDHRVEGTAVYPAAAYIEMALAIAQEQHGQTPLLLEEIHFEKALFLSEEQGITIQLSFDLQDSSFHIFSTHDKQGRDWHRHVSGYMRRLPSQTLPPPFNIHEIQERATQTLTQADCYQQFETMGLEYGPAFQGIRNMWSQPGEAIAALRLPESLVPVSEQYLLHPSLLDACFQVMLGAVHSNERDRTSLFLPVQIAKLCFFASPSGYVWGYAKLRERSSIHFVGDIYLLNEKGEIAVGIYGFRAQSVSRQQSRNDTTSFDELLYQYKWQVGTVYDDLLHAETLPSPSRLTEHVNNNVSSLFKALGRDRYYETLADELDRLVVAYIVQALQALGLNLAESHLYANDTLVKELRIASQHYRLFGRLLDILASEGWQAGGAVTEDIDVLWQTLLAAYPHYQAELMLISRCGQNLAAVLRGEVDPLELIFPSGSQTAEHFYQDGPTIRINNLLAQQIMLALVEQLPADRPLRVLEIGAGTGGTTAYLLSVLPPERTHYVFTDVSSQFTVLAEQKFQQYSFVSFQTLDIEKDPLLQGYEPHAFDVIVASNVLHATADLETTLQHVQHLLTPSGLLLLLETTRPPLWFDIVFGLFKGWWLFSDHKWRTLHPLLSFSKWRALLKTTGFSAVSAVAECDASRVEQHVIVAQVDVPQDVQAMPNTLPSQSGAWLIFADSGGVGKSVAHRLTDRGHPAPISVVPGPTYKRLDERNFQIRPTSPEDCQQLLQAVQTETPLVGILHLWSLNTADMLTHTSTDDISSNTDLTCISTLHLVQTLAQQNMYTQLLLVTRGTQTKADRNTPLALAQAPLWGLGRVITSEHPNLKCKRIDLSAATNDNDVELLYRELHLDDGEDEIMLRGTSRWVNRLQHASLAQTTFQSLDASSFQLEITHPGLLDRLTFREKKRAAPGPGEVEIDVHATALNFKDIAKAMGILADETLEGTASVRAIGLECAGVVSAVGEGVDHFQIGDAVLGFAPNSFSTHTIADARFVIPKPNHLSFEEAATLSLVFVTVHYALNHLAHVQPGERILIHAAAGGVGLAAIQLAQHVNAEIFATAGTPEKRELLRSLGVRHVMDSRSLAFADEIMALTEGQGVDVVLNSLAGEAMLKSVSVLGAYGRFLELGKRDIDQNKKLGLRPFQNNLSYFAIDIDRLCAQRPDFARQLFQEIHDLLATQQLHPLPYRAFPITEVVNAFRYMAKAKHIGKVVVSLRQASAAKLKIASALKGPVTFQAGATYLITGGLGGFGLATARWMAKQGARHLVLLGRQGAVSEEAQRGVEQLQQGGVNVVVEKVDVIESQQVAEVLIRIRQTMPPLRGVVHGAMVLDDAIILRQDRDRFHKVIAPKAWGAWHLHQHTLVDQLDYFVLFSSFAAITGNPGQANYVAANAFLDALAHYRHQQGLPALSMNWGPLEDVGYVADNPDVAAHLTHLGAKPLSSDTMLHLLGLLLDTQETQVAVLRAERGLWIPLQASGVLPRFSQLIGNDDGTEALATSSGSLRDLLNASEPQEREEILMSAVRSQLANVLGMLDPQQIDMEQDFFGLGLDSLMAVEMETHLESLLRCSLPQTALLNHSTISKLVHYLLHDVLRMATEVTGISADSVDLMAIEREKETVAVKAGMIRFVELE